ncbi:MAG: hypothetical protein KDE20_27875, partial [Caldilineaceae bacterium]|nr:hypothetical protein [Caldilineaceae bacterium]
MERDRSRWFHRLARPGYCGRCFALLLVPLLLALTPAGLCAQSIAGAATVAWSPDGSYLAVGAADGAVRVLDTETWRSLVTLRDHAAAIGTLTWSPDGRFLAGSAADGIVHVWDTETWRILSTVETGDIGAATPAPRTSPAAETDAAAQTGAAAETDAAPETDAGAATAAPATSASGTRESTTPAPAAEEPRAVLDVSDFPTVAIEDAAADTGGYYRLQTQWLQDENKCLEGNRLDPERFLGGAAYMDDCQ